MRSFLAFLFGCRHQRTSWPRTLKRNTYVVCLDCGEEFPYDWEEMRQVSDVKSQGRPISECEAVGK